MKKGVYQNARYRMIAWELEHKIRSGEFATQKFFFTRNELARQYQISPVTAFRILKTLEQEHLIQCKQGTRATICSSCVSSGDCAGKRRNIAICTSRKPRNGICAISTDYLASFLENKLNAAGHTTWRIPYDGSQDLLPYDACLLLIELEEHVQLYRTLRSAGMPFCIFARDAPAANAIYVPPGSCFYQLLEHIQASRIQKVCLLRGEDTPLEHIFCTGWNIAAHHFRRVQFWQVEDWGRFRNVNEIMPKIRRYNDGSTLFFPVNLLLAKEIMQKSAASMPFSAVTAVIPDESGEYLSCRHPFPVVDLRLPELGLEILRILFRQLRSGEPDDPGGIHLFEFNSGTRNKSAGLQ